MQGEFKGEFTQEITTSNVNGLDDTKIWYNGKWSKGFKLNQGYNEIDVNGEAVKVYVQKTNQKSGSSTLATDESSAKKSYYTYSSGSVLPKTGESATSKLPVIGGGLALICLGIGLVITLKKRVI